VGPLGLVDGDFDSYRIDLSIVISVLSLGVKIGVGSSCDCRIVLWVRKVSDCDGSSWICGGGGLASVLTLGLTLFGIGYVICGTAGGYVICRVGGGRGRLVVA
jgi:hypothetical protein